MSQQTEYLIHAGDYLAGFREPELAAMIAALGIVEGARRVSLRRSTANRLANAVTTTVTPAIRKQAQELRTLARRMLKTLEKRS